MNTKEIVRLALDLAHGSIQKYSINEGTEVLRQALMTANGGSSKINRKTLRRNKVEIFEIIEELVPSIIQDGLSGDEFWMNYVDERNLALGDENDFRVPDNTTFVVSEVADGIAYPRRQRIGQSTSVSVATSIHGIRMYDEFSRFMAGRIDWAELCDKVAKSFQTQIWDDIYTAFNGITSNTVGLNSTYVISGSYSSEDLVELIEHVEAATGESAVVVGTKGALSKCTSANLSDEARNNMFNTGYYGKVEGTPMICLKQKHKVGTDTFILSDSTVYVLAGGERFIKFVNEGDTYVDDRDVNRSADKTIEYYMEMKYGVALAIAGKIGKYTIS